MRNLILAFWMFLAAHASASPSSDKFLQPVSNKSTFVSEMRNAIPTKVIVDHNNSVYVLTDKGLGRVFNGSIIPDILYRPLQGKTPVDITAQEETGYLYYLYNDAVLTNAHAGSISIKIPAGKYSALQVARDGSVLLYGSAGSALLQNGVMQDISNPSDELHTISVHAGRFYALGNKGVYMLVNGVFKLHHAAANLQSMAFTNGAIIIGTSAGYYAIEIRTGTPIYGLKTKIPIRDIRHLAVAQGRIWAGTPQGAFMEKETSGYDYYASKRWLLEDDVIGMAAGNDGEVYILNRSGVNKIWFKEYTYHNKAAYFENKIRQRHIRYGFIAELRLKVAGDLSSAEMIDTDNDGLWSSFYIGSQAFRYAATGEPIARQYAWETFEAYERLVSINPLQGFPARTFERSGFKVSDPDAWRTGKDPDWEWKGTTSSDEFVGHIFAAAVMDQFVARTKEEKKRIANFIDTILTHIITNDYNFVDADGKPTRWGRWNPDYINWYAKTISDRKLGATHLIAGLQLGYALTGKMKFKDEAMRLMKEHGYLENILISPYNIKTTDGYIYDGTDMGIGPWNHSDDEMEFLSYWVLHHYAFDKKLQKQYDKAIKEFWKIELPEKHPVWNLITLGTEGSFDKESTLWYLREFPVDQIRWDVKNSVRNDLDFLEPNFRIQLTREVLSPRERIAHRYNANEFLLDGGSGGTRELTGAEYLLPYWMARYLKVIQE